MLLSDGTWRHYADADDASLVDDFDGVVHLYDVGGDIVEEFYDFAAVGWAHPVFYKDPHAESFSG